MRIIHRQETCKSSKMHIGSPIDTSDSQSRPRNLN